MAKGLAAAVSSAAGGALLTLAGGAGLALRAAKVYWAGCQEAQLFRMVGVEGAAGLLRYR